MQRFNSLEGLRALMALWVVVGHVILLSGYKYTELAWPLVLLARPVLGVYVFMIMSGFVITHLLSQGRESYVNYILRRWLRLFPLLAFCVTFVVMFAWLDPKHSPFRYDMDGIGLYLLAYATMLHGAIPNEWLPQVAVLFFGTAWSISLEWQFYLVAPAIIALFTSRRYWAVLILFIFAYLTFQPSYTIFGQTFTFLRGSFLLNSLMYFLLGISSHQVLGVLSKQKITTPVALVAAAVVFALTESYPFAIWTIALLGFSSASTATTWLSSRWLVWLGKRSYSIYLTHMIVIVIVRSWVLNPNPNLEPRTLLFVFVLMVLSVSLTIIVSYFTYRFIELPFIILGKARVKKSYD